MSASTPATSQEILRRLLGAVGRVRHPAPYGLVAVRGADAVDFLQRTSSQDFLGMADSVVRPAAFLNAKGRLQFTAHASVRGQTVWLSTQAHQAAGLAEMLERFHFSEDLEVSLVSDWECGELLSIEPVAAWGSSSAELPGGGVALAIAPAGDGDVGLHRRRCHAPAGFFAGSGFNADGLAPFGEESAECLRIAAGEPRVGTDSEANTLALELPIEDHISTTKGCYTGQEIVARIHTYGHTNRALCRMVIDGCGVIEGGTRLVEDDGDPVGRVMSAADIAGDDRRIAFGFLPSVLCEAGTELRLAESGGAVVRVL